MIIIDYFLLPSNGHRNGIDMPDVVGVDEFGAIPAFNLTIPSHWVGAANPVVPDEAWGFLIVILAVYVLVKEYLELVTVSAAGRPLLLAVAFVVFGVVFVFGF